MLLKYRSFKLLATETLPPTGHPQHICTNLSSLTDGPERNIASRMGTGEQIYVVRQSYSWWTRNWNIGGSVIPIQVHYCLIFKQATQPVRMDQRSRAPGTPAIPDKINIKKGAGRDFGSHFSTVFRQFAPSLSPSYSLPLLMNPCVLSSLLSLPLSFPPVLPDRSVIMGQ